MDKANIIISIIIVLCIATAVAAYGIINNDNAVFSDLQSLSSDSGSSPGNGIGNNTTNGTGTSTSSGGSSSSSGSGSGSSSTNRGSNSGSGSHSGNNNNNRPSTTTTVHTQAQIKAIATSAIEEDGCYAGTPSYSNGYWYVNVYDSDGNVVNGFEINDKTGQVSLA